MTILWSGFKWCSDTVCLRKEVVGVMNNLISVFKPKIEVPHTLKKNIFFFISCDFITVVFTADDFMI